MSEIVEEAWKPQRFQARNRSGRSAMTVHPLFEHFSLGPDEISRLAEAYKLTLEALRLRDRDDAMTRKVACSIIEISQTGCVGSCRAVEACHQTTQHPVTDCMSWREITAWTMGVIVATALTVFATVYLATIID
jgi:hypothetical protein